MRTGFLLVLLTSLCILCCFSACQQQAPANDPLADIRTAPPGDEVVAKVGGTVITTSQIDEKQKLYRFGDRKKDRIIEDLISSRLLYLGAVKEGLDRDPLIRQRIQEQIERIIGQIYMNDQISRMGKTDAELKSYYDAHHEDYRLPDQASVSHILLLTAEEAEKVKKEIIDNTKTFADAAKEYSKDAMTGKIGGRLGNVTPESAIPMIGMAPEMNSAIFAAAPGTIIGPFQTSKGFHLLSVDTLEKDRYDDFEKVKRNILDDVIVSDEEISAYYESFKDERFKRKAFLKVKHIQVEKQADAEKALARLKKGESFESLVTELSTDKPSVTQGGDLGILYENGYIPRLGVDRTVVENLFKLDQDQLSDIVPSKNGFHIFLVYEKSPEKYHDLASVRKSIVNILANQKRSTERDTLMERLAKEFAVERLYKDQPEKSEKPQ